MANETCRTSHLRSPRSVLLNPRRPVGLAIEIKPLSALNQTKFMHYFVIDGMLSGTGIRDSVAGGYIEPRTLGISDDLASQIVAWVKNYEVAHYTQFKDSSINSDLDQEGIEICKLLSAELPSSKVEYYSSAEMHKISF